MGRERNKMGLTLRLRGVGYCMRRYEARIWLNLAKARHTIEPHLYFRLILFRRMCEAASIVVAGAALFSRLKKMNVFFRDSYQK